MHFKFHSSTAYFKLKSVANNIFIGVAPAGIGYSRDAQI